MKRHHHNGILHRIILIFIVPILIVSMGLGTGKTVHAASTTAINDGVPAQINNNMRSNYYRWMYAPYTYLTKTESGYMVVVLTKSVTVVKYYDSSFHLQSVKQVSAELPVHGTFLAGSDGYYYISSGQNNSSKGTTAEVFRITRYDHNWNRVTAASLYSDEISMPISDHVGMIEYHGYIVGEMGTTHFDGHQYGLTFEVNMGKMDQVKILTNHYSSHLMGSILGASGDKLLSLQHGDSYPRTIFVSSLSLENTGKASSNTTPTKTILNISASRGDANFTGASIGGLAVTSAGYLVVGNTVDQEAGIHDTYRNIFVCYEPFQNNAFMTDSNSATASLRYFTSFTSEAGNTAATPQLVDLGDGRYMLLWMEAAFSDSRKSLFYGYTADEKVQLHYVIIDEKGNKLSAEYVKDGIPQTDCQPVVSNGKVVWYRRTNATLYPPQVQGYMPEDVNIERFYTIDLNNLDSLQVIDPYSETQNQETKDTEKTETDKKDTEKTTDSGAFFTDVKESDYYYDAVVWAKKEGITSGVSATSFGPGNSCTRGQTVQFLYKMSGEPSVSGTMPFTDVTENDYYCKAVLWAVREGITSGKTATEFKPNDTCTRAEMAQFLYKMNDAPSVASEYLEFTDVPQEAYYRDAVYWAFINGITSGKTATEFKPNDTCTRAQMAQFLYKLHILQEKRAALGIK